MRFHTFILRSLTWKHEITIQTTKLCQQLNIWDVSWKLSNIYQRNKNRSPWVKHQDSVNKQYMFKCFISWLIRCIVGWLDSETCHLQTTNPTKSWKWAMPSWKIKGIWSFFVRQKGHCFGRESLASSLTNGRLDLPKWPGIRMIWPYLSGKIWQNFPYLLLKKRQILSLVAVIWMPTTIRKSYQHLSIHSFPIYDNFPSITSSVPVAGLPPWERCTQHLSSAGLIAGSH